jgi:DNA-binding transcriptional regulator YdaS (Cro superfamily)
MKRLATPGFVRLRQFLRNNNISYARAGHALGVSGPTVWQWCHELRSPTVRRCEDIETWTGGVVPARSWGAVRAPIIPFQGAAKVATSSRR